MGTNDHFAMIWLVGGRLCSATYLRDTESGEMMEKIAGLIAHEHTKWIQVWCFGLTGVVDKTMEWYRADTDQ